MWKFEPARIALARLSRDMSQSDLAQQLGVHVQQVSLWETGSVRPGQESFEKICNALQTPPKFFFVKSGNNGNDCQDLQN